MKNSKIFGGTLLVSGVTIGGGMLALPLATGFGGFFPSSVVFLVCWFFMLLTGFFFLELSLCLKDNPNLVSMAKATLGKPGEVITWILYLLLLYSLLAVYLLISGPLFVQLFDGFLGLSLSQAWGPIIPLVLFGPFIYFGLNSVDHLNRLLMLGMVVTFILMIVFVSPYIEAANLYHFDFDYSIISLAVIITAFGYHVIIPSLTTYLGRDASRVKACLIIGSLIPLVTYMIWELVILGVIPAKGPVSIATLVEDNVSLSEILRQKLGSPTIAFTTFLFSIFAIVTSFIGVAQSLFDFLGDGLKSNKRRSRALVFALTFAPPLIIAIGFKTSVLAVLKYAGLLVAVLLGMMPVLMVWSARYRLGLISTYKAAGGKVALVAVFLFFVFSVALVLGENWGILSLNPVDHL